MRRRFLRIAGPISLAIALWASRSAALSQRDASEPTPASGAPAIAMAANLVYSPIHRRVLLVEGPRSSDSVTETRVWAWDGRDWTSTGAAGPAGRVLAAAAYDVSRRQLLIFGGLRQRDNLDEMWAWADGSWRRLTDTSAGPRDHHVMVYDASRGRVVLFGGSGRRPAGSERKLSPDDTWEWDGNQWHQVATTGPSNRGRSAMAYDEKRREVVLFGGGSDRVLGDTWLWNGQQWRLSNQPGPRPRYAHALAYDAHREVVVLYGGSTFSPAQYFVDMWEWNGERWIETKMPSNTPGVRYSPGMAYDSERRRLVLYGGATLNERHELQPAFDTWEWDGGSWAKLK
jgi:hypothetical protein